METKTAFCDVPNCGRLAAENKYHLCKKHAEMVVFFVWALNNIRIQEQSQARPSGLILPK